MPDHDVGFNVADIERIGGDQIQKSWLMTPAEMREMWEQTGGTDAWARAKEVARRILAEHEPEPLNPATDAWIRERFASSLVLQTKCM